VVNVWGAWFTRHETSALVLIWRSRAGLVRTAHSEYERSPASVAPVTGGVSIHARYLTVVRSGASQMVSRELLLASRDHWTERCPAGEVRVQRLSPVHRVGLDDGAVRSGRRNPGLMPQACVSIGLVLVCAGLESRT